MGAGSSKPDVPQSTHIFQADTPVSFSSDLINSLQSNPEPSQKTDSTRSRTRELHIQQRVHDELEALHASVSASLSETYKKISAEPSPQSSPSSSSSDSPSQPSLTSRISDAVTGDDKSKETSLSHDALAKEIEALKRKLEARKKLVQADKGVEKAKSDVVACLRKKGEERRPLDCWREVEVFRREVGRLEEEFIEKAVR